MTYAQSIIWSCLTLLTLTAAVGTRMLRARLREFSTRRIHPQSAATSITSASTFQSASAIQASDNFKHLFEVPTLFYSVCVGIVATGQANASFAVAAWLFVALRVAHSVIQCTHNQVRVRFVVFAISSVVIVAIWIGFAMTVV